MKLRRYRPRGMTQNNGIGARSVVRYIVSPISQLETTKTGTSHPSAVRRDRRGVGAVSRLFIVLDAPRAASTHPRAMRTQHRSAVASTTKPILQSRAWSARLSFGSTTNG